MKRVLSCVAAAATLAFATVSPANAETAKPKVLGWVEWSLVSNKKIRMRAKLDTGARSSSIHAENVEKFRREGRDWVRFEIRSKKGERARLELPVHRWVRIRRAGAKTHQRAVVLLGICLGNRYKMAQVNLSSRERMSYALLIGRRFMGESILVDSSRRYTIEPNCRE